MVQLSEPDFRNRRITQKTVPAKPVVRMLDKPSKIVELHAKEFSVDEKVQRQLNEGRVTKMVQDFQPHSLGIIIASKRADGHIYTLDGMHRIAAARQAKYDGLIPCRLFENLTVQEEAALFLNYNNSRQVAPIDRFKVRITLGDPDAVNINNILKVYGAHIDWASTDNAGRIGSVATLEKVYHGAGVRAQGAYVDLLDKVMWTITQAWGRANPDRGVYSKSVLEGVGIMWAHFGKSRIDANRLVEILAEMHPRQLQAKARARRDLMGGALGENAAEVIHAAYNHRYKNKLPNFDQVDPRNNHVPDVSIDSLYQDPALFAREA